MTFRKLTELQKKPRNAADMGAFTGREEMNGWNKQDYGRRWIAD